MSISGRFGGRRCEGRGRGGEGAGDWERHRKNRQATHLHVARGAQQFDDPPFPAPHDQKDSGVFKEP